MKLRSLARDGLFLSLGFVAILSYQNCGSFKSVDLASESGVAPAPTATVRQGLDNPVMMSQAASDQISQGQLPSAFGAALQGHPYNPLGPDFRYLPDGAREAYRMGIKALKITLALENLKMDVNRAWMTQVNNVTGAQLDGLTSIVQVAELPAYKYVLSIPFETLFIQTTEIGIADEGSNYWKMSTVPLSQAALNAIYQQHYEFGRYLLKKFKGTGRTFVLQDHEADWHASVWIGPPTYYTENTDIGHANYEKYWTLRQKAVDDAVRDEKSDVRLYNMCEVVRVKDSALSGGKSLTRDVLPKVTCDLIGYSAHDTAQIDDGGATLAKALDYIRSKARVSPTFGQNQVIISEIAYTEIEYANRPQLKDQIVSAIQSAITKGMPWVLYWAFYDHENVGNYIVKPNNDFGVTFYAFLAKLGIAPQKLGSATTTWAQYQVPASSSVVIPPAQTPTPSPTPGPTVTPTPTPLTPTPTPTPAQPGTQVTCRWGSQGYVDYFCIVYQTIFKRAPTSDTIEHFANLYNQRKLGCHATVRDLLAEDPLRRSLGSERGANLDYVTRHYRVTLGRDWVPGHENADALVDQRVNGTLSVEAFDQIFYSHPEFAARCRSFGLHVSF